MFLHTLLDLSSQKGRFDLTLIRFLTEHMIVKLAVDKLNNTSMNQFICIDEHVNVLLFQTNSEIKLSHA